MNDFTKRLLEWYDENPRDLPWKSDQDAYSVWLSEIIMQQTRVEYGKNYYLKFKELYPTVFDLARADLSEVLKAWEGLGYYSRARNLHATAKHVANTLSGTFPTGYKEIQDLKGIGSYTAAAIVSFVHNEPIPAIDGNAFRVLARFFGIKHPIDQAKSKKEFFKKGEELILEAPKRAGDFNQAMMNLGAMVCKPKGADCLNCPIQDGCYAFSKKIVYDLPVKKKKANYKHRFFTFFCFEYNDQFLVQERTAKDVWQNLHQFYLIESEKPTVWEQVIEKSPLKNESTDNYRIGKVWQEKQTLTHQKLSGQIVWVKFNKKPLFYEEYNWVTRAEMKELAFPKMLQNAVEVIHSK